MPLTSSIIFNRHTQQKAKTMKNTKKNKKFSFLEEYKKAMDNPLIQSYKIHLDMLHEAYIEELNKNKKLNEDIINICKHILQHCFTFDEKNKFEFRKKYKKYYDIALKELETIKNSNTTIKNECVDLTKAKPATINDLIKAINL